MCYQIDISMENDKVDWNKFSLPEASATIQNVQMKLLPDSVHSTGDEFKICIRITYDRKRMYWRTGAVFSMEDWLKVINSRNKGKWGEIAKEQRAIFERIKAIVSEMRTADRFSFDELKQKMTGKVNDSFNSLWLERIDNLRTNHRIGTANSYQYAYNSFAKYCGKNVKFNSMNKELIEKWEDRMIRDGISETTTGIYFRSIRIIIRDAIAKGYMKEHQYPFGKESEGKVSISQGSSRRNHFVSVDEVMELVNWSGCEKWDKAYNEITLQSRDMFLFMYLGCGINFADVARLTFSKHYFDSKGKELSFIRHKTSRSKQVEEEVIIPIIPKLKEIILSHGGEAELGMKVFPWILDDERDEAKIAKIVAQGNANIRARLENITKELGWSKKISPTYARHSFATNLAHKNVPMTYISDAMGHSIGGGVTSRYISPFPTEQRMEYNSLLLSDGESQEDKIRSLLRGMSLEQIAELLK